jgi:hypothetical protein
MVSSQQLLVGVALTSVSGKFNKLSAEPFAARLAVIDHDSPKAGSRLTGVGQV